MGMMEKFSQAELFYGLEQRLVAIEKNQLVQCELLRQMVEQGKRRVIIRQRFATVTSAFAVIFALISMIGRTS